MERLIVIVLACAFIFSIASAQAEQFTVNTAVIGVNGFASVAVDVNNTPLVVFSTMPYSGMPLCLLKANPADYEVNELPPEALGGFFPILEVTSNNELSLCYSIYGSSGLWYGSKGSWFDWTFSEIDPSGYYWPDMALSDNDIPHIAYYDGLVQHIWFDVHSQQWAKESLSGFGCPLYNICIDVDSDGKIFICCGDYSDEVSAAICENGYWHYLPEIDNAANPSGCFTSDGLASIAYEKGGELCYAVYISDVIGWVETPIASMTLPGVGKSISLAQSSTGIPAIAYMDSYSLMYATNIAAGWTTILIDENGIYPDLIFDRNDKPLMVYSSYDDCIGEPVLKLAGIGLEFYSFADLNGDRKVNFADYAILAENWQMAIWGANLPGDLNRDYIVDIEDLRWFTCCWLGGCDE